MRLPRPRRPARRGRAPAALLLPFLVPLLGADAGARVEDRLPWHGSGVWLVGDLHTHYVTVKERQGRSIVASAAAEGLDFLVSTDHTVPALGERAEGRLARRREEAPGLLLLAGIEWNVPGGDHAAVVVEQSPAEYELLRDFAARFDREVNPRLRALMPESSSAEEAGGNGDDDADEENDEETVRPWGDLATAAAGLRWLGEQPAAGRPRSVVYLNHPGKYGWLSREDLERLAEAGLAGVAAAPGHQNSDPLVPGYTIDRHEPIVARIGADYDRLIRRGHRLGLAAGSDFHVKRTSYLPGVFSRTFVHAPERSAAGVVAGLSHAATATALGGIVSAVETRLTVDGFADAAFAGETLRVPPGAKVVYRVRAEIPETDFEDHPNVVDQIEIISDCAGKPRLVATLPGHGPGSLQVDWPLPAAWIARSGECFLRVRGRRFIGGEGNAAADADYLFHVSPTRLRVG